MIELFPRCEPGAVPALGQAYDMETVVDRSLFDNPEVYLEGGDHLSLVRVSGSDLRQLMSDVPQRDISR
jgi:Ala-tRNA(Pro) deacylase